MKLIELKIKGISYSENQSGAYALILTDQNEKRKLPIIIGGFEAQSIALELERDIKPPRPLTHDLFKNFADEFKIIIKKIIIYKLIDGVFYSNIICENNQKEIPIDARTSDAIAMGLRFKAPIYIYDSIMKSASFISSLKKENKKNIYADDLIEDVIKNTQGKNLPQELESFSLSKLKSLLKKLVVSEQYEKAAKIRDLISKRNK
tara:strand:- start:128 stop:742 length:615 start_codon:yes stop_codon:yes gene_type:complete